MEVDKRRSKGGFLNLFDWNGKSRKKLFLDSPALPEGSKQEKETVGIIGKTRSQMIEVDESRASPSNKGSGEFNCSLSVTSDEGNGTKAPGVVARLMGLDSLPTSNVPQPYSTPFSESFSVRAAHLDRSNPSLLSEYHSIDYLNAANRPDRFSLNAVESGLHKVRNRPVERFQTESLPPKSAKSIPITHHKLLSPIKSPGFIPKNNVAYIVEAAARIIEASPQASMKAKVPSLASPSVPLRIQDLKEKMEAAHRASWNRVLNETTASKYSKGQHGTPNTASAPGVYLSSERSGSGSLRNKGKSVSLAAQAKDNVQRREGSTSSGNMSSVRHKEKNDLKVNQFNRSQPDKHKITQKGTSLYRTENVLRLNNRKQNRISEDRSASKTEGSDQHGRKVKSSNGSIGSERSVNKVVVNSETRSRKTVSVATSSEKELPLSRKYRLPQKNRLSQRKRSVSAHNSPGSVADCLSISKDERALKCSIATDGHTNWTTDNRKEGMDVVSFTFTSPMIKSTSSPQSSEKVTEKNNNLGTSTLGDNHQRLKSSTFSFPGVNVIGGDALSILLEQKLTELACRVESSNCNVITEGMSSNTASSLPDSMPVVNVVSTASAVNNKGLQVHLDKDTSDYLDDFDCPSIDCLGLQQPERMEAHSSSSNSSETWTEFDRSHSSPLSILEPSLSSGSCSDIRNGSNQMLFVQEQESFSWLQADEYGTELSDTASSTSVRDTTKKHTKGTIGFISLKESPNWELDYVRIVLRNAELRVEELAFGQIANVISHDLFDQLEFHENRTQQHEDEYSKLERKVLFDSVRECLDMRCGKIFVGSSKRWAKWGSLVQRKGRLAEELHREILGWKSMGELMVDELVDKDMSSQYGKWLDFDLEVSEESVEIGSQILTCLLDELVSDVLLF